MVSVLRPAVLLVCVMLPAVAVAEDARVTFLTKQLSSAKDSRLRTQTLLLLGQTGSDDAAVPLCAALDDPDTIVRATAASALGELRAPKARECLARAAKDADASVRAAAERALAGAKQGAGSPGGLYVALDPVLDKAGSFAPPLLALADKLLRDKLASLGAVVAPATDDVKAAAALVKARNLQGYQVRAQLGRGEKENALKLELLIMTFPDKSLKGQWSVTGVHPKQEAVLKAMVPKVVDDAARELEWKK